MTQSGGQDSASGETRDGAALRQGRREGLAVAALALSLVAFLNLLGTEKSVLAIILAALALSGSRDPHIRRRASIALALALVHLITIAVVLVLFRDRLGDLIRLLQTLG